MTKGLKDYITEAEAYITQPAPGDEFDIEIAPGDIVSTYVLESTQDSVTVYGDEKTMALLETIRRYGAVGSNRGQGYTLEDKCPDDHQAEIEGDNIGEASLSDLDVERQDYERMSPAEFQRAYGKTKQEWQGEYDSMFNRLQGQTLRTMQRTAKKDPDYCDACDRPNNRCVCESVEEARHFRTSYGWAGGYNEKTGKKYRHPEQTQADREARKQQKSQEKQSKIKESVNAKQIKKDLDSGMSYDAVIGKHANKRMANTDEIRRVIQQHAWEKRTKQPKIKQGVSEGQVVSLQACKTPIIYANGDSRNVQENKINRRGFLAGIMGLVAQDIVPRSVASSLIKELSNPAAAGDKLERAAGNLLNAIRWRLEQFQGEDDYDDEVEKIAEKLGMPTDQFEEFMDFYEYGSDPEEAAKQLVQHLRGADPRSIAVRDRDFDDHDDDDNAVAQAAKTVASTAARTQAAPAVATGMAAFKDLLQRVMSDRRTEQPQVKDMGQISRTGSAPALPAPDQSAVEIMAQLRDIIGRDLSGPEKALVRQKLQGVAEGILGDREYNRVMPVVKRIAGEVSDYDRDEFGEELWSLLDQKYGSKFAQSVLDDLDVYWDTYTELAGQQDVREDQYFQRVLELAGCGRRVAEEEANTTDPLADKAAALAPVSAQGSAPAVNIDEGVMKGIAADLAEIADSEDFDRLYDLMTSTSPAGEIVQKIADDVMIDHRLGDDDHEEILELVMDRLIDEFGGYGLDEAEYQGRKVELNKPMKGDVAKSKVYVKDPKTGNVKKVNFGDPNMRIKKSNPARRKSFRARHNCDNPGPRTKARYWSCKAW